MYLIVRGMVARFSERQPCDQRFSQQQKAGVASRGNVPPHEGLGSSCDLEQDI